MKTHDWQRKDLMDAVVRLRCASCSMTLTVKGNLHRESNYQSALAEARRLDERGCVVPKKLTLNRLLEGTL